MKLNKEIALEKAKGFLENKYPELKSNEQWVGFDNIYWAKSGVRSFASRNGFAPKYRLKDGLAMRVAMKPSRKKKWYSYFKKTPSGWICPAQGVDVEPQVGLEITLVHEFTHILQYILGLPVGELLTTTNEQEYVMENYPHYARFLITYEARKFQEQLKKRKATFKRVNGKWPFTK